MSRKDYEHWNEEADIVWMQENKDAMERGSPEADMTDAEIKQAVYDSMNDDDDWGDSW